MLCKCRYAGYSHGQAEESCNTRKKRGLISTESCKNVPAKFGKGSSVRAGWRSIDCAGLMDSRKAGKSNMQKSFCTTLYTFVSLFGCMSRHNMYMPLEAEGIKFFLSRRDLNLRDEKYSGQNSIWGG